MFIVQWIQQFLIPVLFLLVPLTGVFRRVTGQVDGFIEPRWIMVYLIATPLMALLAFSTFDLKSLPRSKLLSISLILAALSAITSIVTNFHAPYEFIACDAATFFAIFLTSWSLSRTPDSKALLVRSIGSATLFSTLVVLTVLALQWGGYPLPTLGKIEGGSTGSLFGHKNFLGEFLAISLLIQSMSLRRPSPLTRGAVFRGLLFAASALSLFMIHARGALLGAFAGFAVLWVPRPKLSLKTIGLAASALGAALIVATLFNLGHLTEVRENSRLRFARWVNTVALIADHPLGVGPGNYEFEYLPYRKKILDDSEINEANVARSPHNLPLQVAAEYGWVTLLALTLALAILLPRIRSTDALSYAILVTILVDGLSAFPFQVPYPFFVFAVFLGIGLAPRASANPALAPSFARFGIALLMIALSGVIGTRGWQLYSAVRAEAYDFNDLDRIGPACEALPSRWTTCLQAMILEGNRPQPNRAIEVGLRMIRHQPKNHLAHYILSRAYELADRPEDACRELRIYDGLFGGRSSAQNVMKEICEGPSTHSLDPNQANGGNSRPSATPALPNPEKRSPDRLQKPRK